MSVSTKQLERDHTQKINNLNGENKIRRGERKGALASQQNIAYRVFGAVGLITWKEVTYIRTGGGTGSSSGSTTYFLLLDYIGLKNLALMF